MREKTLFEAIELIVQCKKPFESSLWAPINERDLIGLKKGVEF